MRTPRIRHYLTLLVLAAFLPVAGLALALFALSLKSENEVGWRRSEARTTFIAAAVQTQMDALAGTLDVLSASPALRDGDLTTFHSQARAITGERVDAVSLVRPDGVTMLNSRVPPGQPAPAFSVPEDQARLALAEGRTVITGMFNGATSRRAIFAMIRPVTVAGKPHALAVGLFASRFEPLVDRTLPPWTAALLDGAGQPVVQFPRQGGPTDLHAPAIATDAAGGTHGRLTLRQADGAEHMVTFERIPHSGWMAVSSLPRGAVEGPALHTAALYAVGAVLLSVPSVLLALWLGLRLASSMKALAQFATTMGAEPSPAGMTLPPLKRSCRELDVVAAGLEQAACDIAARDAQLRQQRDLAESNAARIARQSAELSRSNADLEQFAYVASHDLREPLRMVSSFLTLLERHLGGQLDAEGREFVGYARDGALRMDRMILDLLQYSRVGRVETAIEAVDLAAMVQQARNDLADQIAQSGAEVTVDGTLPVVEGYPGELARLFLNLIGNAIKYRAADRTPRIVVSATHLPEGWQVTVADNGIGIDAQFHERVFAIFQRLHTRQAYDGNGIGLAICKKVVEHHGGRIWVESTPGNGAAFRFILPDTLPSGAVSPSA